MRTIRESFRPESHRLRPLLAEIKARVQLARVKAGLAPNRELLTLYWDIGRLILDRQQMAGWGAKVIDRPQQTSKANFPVSRDSRLAT